MGVWGAGIGGVVKLLLLYIAAIMGGIIVLFVTGGPDGLMQLVRSALVGTSLGEVNDIQTAEDILPRFGSLLARGPLNDLGSGLSLVLGVLSHPDLRLRHLVGPRATRPPDRGPCSARA